MIARNPKKSRRIKVPPQCVRVIERSPYHLRIAGNHATKPIAEIIAAGWNRPDQNISGKDLVVTKICSNPLHPELLISINGSPTRGHVLIRFEKIRRGATLRIGTLAQDSYELFIDDDDAIRDFSEMLLRHWDDFAIQGKQVAQ